MTAAFLIKKILMTERSVNLQSSGKYVFIVEPHATKNEVKKAVKDLYHVNATAVNIVHLPGKPKRYRNVKRVGPGTKKAIVTLAKGEKIDVGQ